MSRALSIRSNLERYLVHTLNLAGPSELKSCTLMPDRAPQQDRPSSTDAIRKCLVSGYFSQAARIAPDGTHWISLRETSAIETARTFVPTTLWMHPTSILFKQAPQWVIFHEVVETAQGKAYMREVTAIEAEWLEQLAPHFYTMKRPHRE